MKTVGKQLQEARVARNWTPELAARETKIKVDRLRDLEGDDYSHFTSPTYARGFVRTYARALGLDEYRILRQLDNKLPDADSANIVSDTGVTYLPETAMPPRVAHRDYTGLYVVMGLGAAVSLVIAFVLFEAYRVGELSRYFGGSTETVVAGTSGGTNAANAVASPLADAAPKRALPIDSDTPPPLVDPASAPNVAAGDAAVPAKTEPAPVTIGTAVPPRAIPVDPASLPTSGPSAPDANIAGQAPRALPVDPADLAPAAQTSTPPPTATSSPADGTAPDPAKAPLRALPVSPAELAADSNGAGPATTVAMNTVSPVPANPADGANATDKNAGSDETKKSDPVESAPASPAVMPANGNPGGDGTEANSTSPVIVPAQADPSPANGAAATNTAPPSPVPPTPSAPPAGRSPVMEPSLPAVEPSTESNPPAPEANTDGGSQPNANSDKRLVLTASHDSFVRVTSLDAAESEPLYAAVLHSGQSVAFDGHKFSINVGVPSAVDIKLDGVNYGPHSDQEEPETFTVQSHLP